MCRPLRNHRSICVPVAPTCTRAIRADGPASAHRSSAGQTMQAGSCLHACVYKCATQEHARHIFVRPELRYHFCRGSIRRADHRQLNDLHHVQLNDLLLRDDKVGHRAKHLLCSGASESERSSGRERGSRRQTRARRVWVMLGLC